MATQDTYGGLTSTTGSVGGGGDGSRHDDDRGVFFPEYDAWARQNGIILKTTTKAKDGEGGISENITIDIDFNDGAWRPSSTVIANEYMPKRGDEHPTISGCWLYDISIQHYQNQPDHFRASLSYKFPDQDEVASLGSGGNGSQITPLDAPFIIRFNPVIIQKPIKEDLNGKPVSNVNGEPYNINFPSVRLDGLCTWNQRSWNQSDITRWVGKVNSDVWAEGDYRFNKYTVICNYVIGNLSYFSNDEGQQEPFYRMEAGISYYPNGAVGENGTTRIRSQGSFYYQDDLSRNSDIRFPKARTTEFNYDISNNGSTKGFLQSGDRSIPLDSNPDYDEFVIYEAVNFNFVDR